MEESMTIYLDLSTEEKFQKFEKKYTEKLKEHYQENLDKEFCFENVIKEIKSEMK